MTWYDITLKQMQQLEELEKDTSMSEEDMVIERMNIIYNEDCSLLTVPEFMQRVNDCQFLSKPIPKTKVKGKYTINGREYEVMMNLFEMSMGQYIDFKNIGNRPERLYSIIFIPKGHKYNDGYDMETVWEDMLCLPAPDVAAINRFFFRLTKKYQTIIRLSLKRLMKRMRTQEDRMRMESLIQIMDSFYLP